jgi:hypothetical protein
LTYSGNSSTPIPFVPGHSTDSQTSHEAAGISFSSLFSSMIITVRYCFDGDEDLILPPPGFIRQPSKPTVMLDLRPVVMRGSIVVKVSS